MSYHSDLEHKYAKLDIHQAKGDEIVIQGYASLFGQCDQGGDTVQKGAYAKSLARLDQDGRAVKMLWQHNPAEPIGVWDAVYEDEVGLFVKGRLLPSVARAKEAAELLSAGALDGLSIGYKTIKSKKSDRGGRCLIELDLWEVSLVTFPMLPTARVAAKSDDPTLQGLSDIAEILREAAQSMRTV